MLVYLRNLDSYDAVAELDLSALTIRFASRKRDGNRLAGHEFSGWYQVVDARFIAFYRHPDTQEIHLHIEGNDLPLRSDMVLESRYVDAWQDEFVIRQNGIEVFTHLYQRPQIDSFDRLRIDMADIDYEELDIFVLACNIWNDLQRRSGAMTGPWKIELAN
jgi:hypothetical protein